MARVEIDQQSGFCFGVVTAINKAEDELDNTRTLYCLGDIVHNNAEVERLTAKGLVTIDHEQMSRLSNVKVLLRAHGEPPATYALARQRGITLVDATCPVVLKLQKRIKDAYNQSLSTGRPLQILIYGRLGHAEVNGLVGQTNGTAIVIERIDDLSRVDFTRGIALYSQTTKSPEGYHAVIAEIEKRLAPGVSFEHYDTICRQVANRVHHLQAFAAEHQVVLFVAGAKSSNGRILYNHCLCINANTHLVGKPDDIDPQWFTSETETVGICGATSTPRWLMEDIAESVTSLLDKHP